jgi:hypothetical protein
MRRRVLRSVGGETRDNIRGNIPTVHCVQIRARIGR